jgi:hypothetical protein
MSRLLAVGGRQPGLGVTGGQGSSWRSGRSRACSAQRPPRSSGPTLGVAPRASVEVELAHRAARGPRAWPGRRPRAGRPEPKRRRRSSISTAARRSSASSSSSVRSALRVTRKANVLDRRPCPGKSRSRWAAMTCSSGTKRSPSGMTTNRGSSGGTFTRAKRRSSVTGSRSGEREVQREARDVREGVAGVDGERGEDREDAGVELAAPGGLAVVVVELGPAGRQDDPVARPDSGATMSSRKRRSRRSTRVRARAAGDGLAAARAGLLAVGRACGGCLAASWSSEPGDADLEELVEVLAEDGAGTWRARAGGRVGSAAEGQARAR